MLWIVQCFISKGHGSSAKDCAERAAAFVYDDGWRNFIERQAERSAAIPPVYPVFAGVSLYILIAFLHAMLNSQKGPIDNLLNEMLIFIMTSHISFGDWVTLSLGIVAVLGAFVTFPVIARWDRTHIDRLAREAVADLMKQFRLKDRRAEANKPESFRVAIGDISNRIEVCDSWGARRSSGPAEPTLHEAVNISTAVLAFFAVSSAGIVAKPGEPPLLSWQSLNLIETAVIGLGLMLAAFLPRIFARFTDAMSGVPQYCEGLRVSSHDLERGREIAEMGCDFVVKDYLKSKENCLDKNERLIWVERTLRYVFRRAWWLVGLSCVFLAVSLWRVIEHFGEYGGIVRVVAFWVVIALPLIYSAIVGAGDLVRMVIDRISGRSIVISGYGLAILGCLFAALFSGIPLFVTLRFRPDWWELAVLPVFLAWVILVVMLRIFLPRRVDKRLAERFTKAAESITAILEYHATRENEVHMTKASPRKGNAR